MRIDASGNVGIGCIPDTALNAFGYKVLEVAGANTTKSGAILLSNSSGTDFGQIYADSTDGWKFVNGQTTKSTIFYGGSGTSEQMRIGSSGTVKISHADTASEGLRVIQTTAGRTSGGALGLFYDDQAGTTQPTLQVIQNGTGDILQLFDGGSQVVTVQDGGNVGIGTSSPAVELNVNSSTIQSEVKISNSGTGNTANDGFGLLNNGSTAYVWNYEAGVLLLGTSNAERVRIDSSGNVLVGMTSTGSTGGMYIDQTGNVVAASVGANGTSTKFKWTSPVFNAGSQEKHGIQLYNGASQNIQFGFISDSGGNQGAFIDTSSTNLGTIIRSDTNGVRLANGATSWSSYSDSRLKDVTGEIPNALDKIDAMRGILFSWNDDEENTQRCGVIAQEVQAVLPEVVDTDTDYLQVRYTEMIPLLIQGIKEQQTIIESLTARITALES